MQEHNTQVIEEDEIDLRELFATIWKGRIFIAVFVSVVVVLTLIYALAKPNVYESKTILLSQEQSGGMKLGGLGGLAAMAGVDIGGSSGGDISPVEHMKIILSDYEFQAYMIEKYDLKSKMIHANENLQFAFGFSGIYDLFHSTPNEEDIDEIELVDVVEFYQELIVMDSDDKVGTVTMRVEHENRYFAKEILELFLQETTQYYRTYDMQEVEKKIRYYDQALSQTSDIQLKTQLSELVSSLVQKRVLSQASKYYMFKQITKPRVAHIKEKTAPKRALILVVSLVTATILAIFALFLREFIANNREAHAQ